MLVYHSKFSDEEKRFYMWVREFDTAHAKYQRKKELDGFLWLQRCGDSVEAIGQRIDQIIHTIDSLKSTDAYRTILKPLTP
jgi:hypothetical protein